MHRSSSYSQQMSAVSRKTLCSWIRIRVIFVICCMFVVGIVFGHAMHLFGPTALSDNIRKMLGNHRHDTAKSIPDKNDESSSHLKASAIKRTMLAVPEKIPPLYKEDEQKSPHRALGKRPGLSIKKDMSIQFRDYKPKKLFINCAAELFPWSLELFLTTYPKAKDYQLVSFLPDKSYSVLYKKFPNHTLHTPYLVSTTNQTEAKDMRWFGSAAAITEHVKKIDLTAWLKANTRHDDYVILKIDSKQEKEIAKDLVDKKILENIDKYYTTSSHVETVDFVTNQFKARGHKVNLWESGRETYSDIEDLNPARIPQGIGRTFKQCQPKTDPEQFALQLYASHPSIHIYNTIRLLNEYSPSDKLALTVFLPFSFWQSRWTEVWRLFRTLTPGLYLDDSVLESKSEFRLRNAAMATQNVLEDHKQILQYVRLGLRVDPVSVNRTLTPLHYHLYQGGRNINHLTTNVTAGQIPGIDDTGRKHGEFLTIDIAQPRAEYLVLYMLRRFRPWIVPLSDCVTKTDRMAL